MKHFSIWDYNKVCEVATYVEDKMNCYCGNKYEESAHWFEKDYRRQFVIACVSYWSESERWDDRNRYAVLLSKKIIERFPEFKAEAETYGDECLMNADGFTCCAHRYLQNEFFRSVCLEWFNHFECKVNEYLEEMEFVYTQDGKDMIPYKECRRA